MLRLSTIWMFALAVQAEARPLPSAQPVNSDTWLSFAESMTAFQPVEPPGSLGSYGLRIGLVTAEYSVPDQTPGYELQYSAEPSSVILTRGTVTCGTPWPVNLGIAYGTTMDRMFSVASAQANGTVFERPLLPTVGVRVLTSKLLDVASTTMQTVAADLTVGYGFLRYFNVFGSIGMQQAEGEVQAEPLLALYPRAEASSHSQLSPQQSLGAQVKLLNPFIAFAAEHAVQTKLTTLRLSIGM